MSAMHHTIDEKVSPQDPNGSESFSVQLDSSTGEYLTLNTGGIFETTSEGQERLYFSWLNRRDIYILAYFLCGVASFLPAALDRKANPQDKTAEQYLRMALNYVNEAFKPNNASKASLAEACKRQKWLRSMAWLIRLHLTFIACGRKDWQAARNLLQTLQESAGSISAPNPEACFQLTTYLDGIIHQGQGNLEKALAAFRSPVLSLPEDIDSRSPDISTDLRILAALNSVLILLDPNHPENFLCDPLISAVEPLCLKNPNKNIHAAFNLIKSTATSLNSIVKRKQYLANAISSAKETNNHQILCICLTMMSEAFFRDSIGAQAEKSAMSASNMAQKWGDPMWMCITASLCGATFERQGKMQEAASKMRIAYSLKDKLPEPLKENNI